jgi:hypothetical protein
MARVEGLHEVEVGSLVRWNGRTNPQVVTEVTDSWFEVRSHSDSYYRFYPQGQYLVNQQSGTEYDIDQFKILGEVYDVDTW